jgi:CRP/FNR family transcriptional regulator, dissimilatory nitrate respiration regulator
MVRDRALEQVRRHYLFAAFSDVEFASVAAQTTVHRWSEGGLLFQRGDPASQFFVVLEGEVRLYLQSRDGVEAMIQRARPGDGFAEAVMFMQMPVYPVSAELLGRGAVAAVGNEAYRALMHRNSSACLSLLGNLSAKLHGLLGEIESLTLESAQSRVLRHLLALAGPDASGAATVRLHEAKQALAARLAIKPETLSRALRALSADGLIAVDGPEIRIRDMERLRGRA